MYTIIAIQNNYPAGQFPIQIEVENQLKKYEAEKQLLYHQKFNNSGYTYKIV